MLRIIHTITGVLGFSFLMFAMCCLDTEGMAYTTILTIGFVGALLLLTFLLIHNLFFWEDYKDDFR